MERQVLVSGATEFYLKSTDCLENIYRGPSYTVATTLAPLLNCGFKLVTLAGL